VDQVKLPSQSTWQEHSQVLADAFLLLTPIRRKPCPDPREVSQVDLDPVCWTG
jgi:hypothetical protein